MSAPGRAFKVKGWCPGVLRPMESGDGLLVRIRPRAASLTRAQINGVALIAERYGNGHVDLTRRANLQIRGVRTNTLAPLQQALGALGLLDETVDAESIPNILINPLAGIDPSEILDMRPLAFELADHLASTMVGQRLAPKFSVVLDGGGLLRLDDERADIRLAAMSADGGPMVAIGRAGIGWLGMTEPENAVSFACALIAGKSPRLQLVETLSVQSGYIEATWLGHRAVSAGCSVVGVGAPFGRLEAHQLRVLAALGKEVRVSPWRAFYVPVGDGNAERVLAIVQGAGLVTEADDPLMRIQACPGRPACRSAYADTRADAARTASWMRDSAFTGTMHLSGCPKGCASSAAADITLVGAPGGYRLLRHLTARDEGGTFLPAADVPRGLNA